MLKVAVVGPESSGKTTLCQSLADLYQVSWVPEYARIYAERKNVALTEADVEPIARGQLAAEDLALGSSKRLIILDTDLTTTVFYANHLYGACDEWIVQESKQRLADLYLLCLPDLPWVPDPVRSASDITGRLAVVSYYENMQNNICLHKISGFGDQRLLAAKAAVDQLLLTWREKVAKASNP